MDADAGSALSKPPMDRAVPDELETATVALGCFWGPDARFGAIDGVVRTRVGYAGGTTPEPTYESIGDHIEAVQVDFDPAVVTYRALLDVFWRYHDPTRAPWKRQYQTALFPHTDAQQRRARATKKEVATQHSTPLATEVIPEAPFYRAEDYHQKYKLRHHTPLMQAFQRIYGGDGQAFVDAPSAALVNGYVSGHRAPDRLNDDRERLGLPDDAFDALRTISERRH
jgi:peptide-methionine (S)-S-oxide reductase